MERARRALAPNAKQKALAQLADLKKNGVRRSDQFEVHGPLTCRTVARAHAVLLLRIRLSLRRLLLARR